MVEIVPIDIRWTTQSIEDLENIADYISKDSVKYAEIQIASFFESITILELFPKAGRVVPELGDKKVRELIIGFYRLIYNIINSGRVDILTVHHAKRLLKPKKLRTFIKNTRK